MNTRQFLCAFFFKELKQAKLNLWNGLDAPRWRRLHIYQRYYDDETLGRWQKSHSSHRLISFESPALLPGASSTSSYYSSSSSSSSWSSSSLSSSSSSSSSFRLNLPTWYSDRQSSKQPPDRWLLAVKRRGGVGGLETPKLADMWIAPYQVNHNEMRAPKNSISPILSARPMREMSSYVQ